MEITDAVEAIKDVANESPFIHWMYEYHYAHLLRVMMECNDSWDAWLHPSMTPYRVAWVHNKPVEIT